MGGDTRRGGGGGEQRVTRAGRASRCVSSSRVSLPHKAGVEKVQNGVLNATNVNVDWHCYKREGVMNTTAAPSAHAGDPGRQESACAYLRPLWQSKGNPRSEGRDAAGSTWGAKRQTGVGAR